MSIDGQEGGHTGCGRKVEDTNLYFQGFECTLIFMKKEPRWASVAVNRPLDQFFTYEIPNDMRELIVPRIRVKVPFGRSYSQGVVVDWSGPPPSGIVAKPIAEILEKVPLLTEEGFRLFQWVSDYYGCPLGEVIGNCFPLLRRSQQKRLIVKSLVSVDELQEHLNRISRKAPAQARILAQCIGSDSGIGKSELIKSSRAGYGALKKLVGNHLLEEVLEEDSNFFSVKQKKDEPLLLLSEGQKKSIAEIESAFSSGGFAPFLLFGVTGSGKTEVYLKVLEKALTDGGQALVMLPEIALTPQTFSRFASRFPGVVLLHSLLSPSERAKNLFMVKQGEAKVVIGARSAVFAPFKDLRLIVVDEEHENSFKQESSPRYHGRDVAVYRASRLGIPIILGSATPSLESYTNAKTGRYKLLVLKERVTPVKQPAIRVIDLSVSKRRKRRISQELLDLTADTLSKGNQAIFFLNRRGYAPLVKCLRCGYDFPCPDCSVSLTYHKRGDLLLCHTCGNARSKPKVCPQCGVPLLNFIGAGTERIVKDLKKRFHSARIGRLDRDMASSRKNLLKILDDFSNKRLDILVGTQMVTKGHDFPDVTLVGIICADMSLNFPDFRATERTYQLIHQVAGRAGRGEAPAKVVLQTYCPRNRVIHLALSGDFETFVREETSRRKPLLYPPFGRILRIVLRGKNVEEVKKAGIFTADILKKLKGRVLGPAPCPVEKIKGLIRYQIIIKAENHFDIKTVLLHFKRIKFHRGIVASWDVDPVSFL